MVNIHCRVEKETLERLKKAKSRFHSTSYDDIINKVLDASEGKEIRKLEGIISTLKSDKIGLEAVNLERREENRKLIEEKKPLEDKIQLLSEEMGKKDGELKAKDKELKKELADMKNLLQIKGQEVISLQTDIEYWKTKLQEVSRDTVLEENQYLKVQLGQKGTEIEAKNERIIEVEKLIKIASSQKEDIINTVFKTLRDFKQFIPSMSDACKQCTDSSSFEQYGKNVLKSISNLEGYLNTCRDHAS